MKLHLSVIFLLLGALCIGVPVANADIIAQFEDGSATPGVDTVPGVTGDGWIDGWALSSTGTGTKARKLVTDNPIGDDGNNMAFTLSTTTTSYKCSVYRKYGDYGDLDISDDDYVVSFTLRLDDLGFIDDYPAATTNRLYLYGSNAPVNTHDATKTTWAIRAQSILDSPNDRVFRFLGSGGATDYSDVAAIEGHVYEFDIVVHSTDFSYEGYVTDVTTNNSFKSTLLPFESTESIVSNHLSCLAEMKQSSTFGCSIDNVRIAEVPEPGTLVLLTGMLAGLLVWRKK